MKSGLTGLITAKAGGDEVNPLGPQPFGFMQFMVDCAVVLNHRVELGVSQRNLRVQKYRGSSFDENESPFVIGRNGFDVAIARMLGRVDAKVTNERVTSGVKRLDTMLGGGYYRGASVLITGVPGTAKTTLSGAFAEAACRRGERTMFVGFDSDGTEVIRNLSSVNIRLDRFVKTGLLRMISARTITGSAETLLVRIKALAKEHNARCLVIDPVSTLSKAGNELTAHGVAERLIDWSKSNGITLVCTSLLDEMNGQTDGGTPLQISTLADTWIHLNYLVQAGERNRGLSIIKSRGMAHSNQVRELILSDDGVTLTDIYTAGGEVLMGTLRWKKKARSGLPTRSPPSPGSSSASALMPRKPCSKCGRNHCRRNWWPSRSRKRCWRARRKAVKERCHAVTSGCVSCAAGIQRLRAGRGGCHEPPSLFQVPAVCRRRHAELRAGGGQPECAVPNTSGRTSPDRNH